MGQILLWVAVAVLVVASVALWRHRKARTNRFVSVVLLLNQPRQVTEAEFVAACERAFRTRLETDDVVPLPPPGRFALRRGDLVLALMTVDEPYVRDPGAEAERLRLFELKEVMRQHRAWLGIDLMSGSPSEGDAQAHRWVSRLAAEFLDDGCLGIYCVKTGQLNVVRMDTVELMTGPDPLKAFEYIEPNTTVEVQGDDAEIVAAQAEAKRRWPEFVAAFQRKRPMQGFAIKSPFPSKDGSWEHIWVEVDRIDGQTIFGRLANEPRDVPGRKLGDAVTVSIDDIEDWLYEDRQQMVGGFTTRVLQSRE